MTTHFPDVSNHQKGLSLAGALACIAKASQGAGYSDPYYAGFRDQARSLGIPFAGYHWITADDIDAQARRAYSMLGPDVPLMWDAEAAGATVDRILAATHAYRALGGLVTLLYLPKWWWRNYLGSPDLTPLRDAGLALISSNYTTYSDAGPGWDPYGGVYPVIWQYTSSYPFNGYLIDHNAFKGTVSELDAVFHGGDDMANYGELIWRLLEDGVRPVKPDTWTPEGGYESVTNDWLGTILGKTQQDAYRTRVGMETAAAEFTALRDRVAGLGDTTAATAGEVAALRERVDGLGDGITEIITRLNRLIPPPEFIETS